MATLRKRYVDPDVSGGAGDGTSWANAYASLNAAEQAEDNNGALTTTDEYVEFVCGHNGASQTTADTAAVTISGWTTDATRYIHIYTETADRHAGGWSTTKYRLSVTDAIPIYVNEDYIRLEGLQCESVSPTAANRHILRINLVTASTNETRISSCLLKGHAHGTHTQTGIRFDDADCIGVIWNTIVYNLTALTGNRAISFASAALSLYSCTVIGGAYGLFATTGTVTAKNTYIGGTLTEDWYRSSGTLNKTNCASEDQSADDTSGTDETATNCVAAAVDCTTSGVTFTDPSTGDFSIADVDSALYSVGVDTTGDAAPLNFTTDITGATRDATWDIGAHCWVVAGGLTKPVAMYHYLHH